MALIILLHILIVLLAAIFNSLTIYHFLRYRYEGDNSKIFILFFVFIFFVLTIMPFYFLDYKMENQSIIEKLIGDNA